MGKNLKGKECGKGICQRKDGLYSARYVDELGKRHDKYFTTLPEARNWLKQAKEAPIPQDDLFIPNEMTVDTWFAFWIDNIVGDLAPNTRRNYRERYKHNIQPVLGKMRLVDVKPMYCKIVLNRMEATYAGSTIRQTYIAMGTMFKSAVMNGLISKHPMDGVRFNKPVRAVDDIHFLTVDEQEKFLEVAKRSHNYLQYALILVYHPESYKPVFISPLDYETYEEYAKAQQELGFEYEITIYRDYPDLEILNDPDFESVFELFRAHTTK